MPSEDGSPPCAAPLYCRPCTAPPVLMLYTLYRAPLMGHAAPCRLLPCGPSRKHPVLPPCSATPCTAPRTLRSSPPHAVRSIEHHSCCTLHRAPLVPHAPSSTTHAVCSIEHHSCCTPCQLTPFEICIMCQTIHRSPKSPYDLVRLGGNPPATCQVHHLKKNPATFTGNPVGKICVGISSRPLRVCLTTNA